MIFFRKFFLKTVVSTIMIAFLFVAPYPLFSKINKLNYNLNKEYSFDYSGILELWNIDTFEGGSVNRAKFLEKRAVEFEKQHKGTLVLVKNMTLDQLKLNLQNNKKPNLITFGIGAGSLIFDNLISFKESFSIREDLLKSAKINNNLKALPIMLGGYTLITNKEKLQTDDIAVKLSNSIVYSTNEYNKPLLSLFVNNLKISKQNDYEVDSFSAYDKFINNNFCSLLGTQRDYFRCKNRENNLKMQCDYDFLGGYSDLIVYGSVFKSDRKTENVCEKFLEYLVSETSQEKLNNIGLFSILNKNIYNNDEDYKIYNQTLLKKIKTINVFNSEENLQTLQTLLNDYFYKNINNKNEILKYLE